MNIDELKNTWNEDDSFEETPEISMEQKDKIHGFCDFLFFQ